jgi:hypothetical protein
MRIDEGGESLRQGRMGREECHFRVEMLVCLVADCMDKSEKLVLECKTGIGTFMAWEPG